MGSKPNIVFICLDQLAASALSIYGNKLTKTPAIEKHAASGVVFDNYWCNSPLCGPARYTIFTGQMPFPNLIGGVQCVHYPYVDYMGDYFHNAGYDTFSIGKLHGMPETFDFGFRQARINDMALCQRIKDNSYSSWIFDNIADRTDKSDIMSAINKHYATNWYNVDRTLDEHYFIPYELSENQWIDDETTLFLQSRKNSKAPFIMHIGINYPHPAWCIIPSESDRTDPENVTLPDTFDTDWRSKNIVKSANIETFMMENITDKWSSEDWKKWIAKYYTGVNIADKAIERITDLIEEYGYKDNTIFVITTDHGDMLGDFMLEAKYFFYNSSVRIPLIISGAVNNKNIRTADLADQLDLIPTMLDLAGLDITHKLTGQSLKDIVNGNGKEAKYYVHGWLDFHGRRLTMTVSRNNIKICTLDQGYARYMPQNYFIGRVAEMYDLKNDPLERQNIFGECENSFAADLLNEHVEYFKKFGMDFSWILDTDKDHSYEPPILRHQFIQDPPVAKTFDLTKELHGSIE